MEQGKHVLIRIHSSGIQGQLATRGGPRETCAAPPLSFPCLSQTGCRPPGKQTGSKQRHIQFLIPAAVHFYLGLVDCRTMNLHKEGTPPLRTPPKKSLEHKNPALDTHLAILEDYKAGRGLNFQPVLKQWFGLLICISKQLHPDSLHVQGKEQR